MTIKRRGLLPLMTVFKQHVQSAFAKISKNEVFNVRVQNERAFYKSINQISNKLDKVVKHIKRFPKIEFKGTPASLQIQSFSEQTLKKLIKELEEVKGEVKKREIDKFNLFIKQLKEISKNKTKFPVPEKFPLRQVVGELNKIEQAIHYIKIPEYKPQEIKIPSVPKEIRLADSKKLLKAIEGLKEEIKKISQSTPEIEFPGSISIDNFPPQKIPQPVTNININPLRGFAKSRSVTVGTTITPLPGEVLDYRRSLIIFNNDSTKTVEVGGSTMTFGTGLPIPPKTYSPPMDAGPRLIIYGIVSSGTVDVRVCELSNEDIGG